MNVLSRARYMSWWSISLLLVLSGACQPSSEDESSSSTERSQKQASSKGSTSSQGASESASSTTPADESREKSESSDETLGASYDLDGHVLIVLSGAETITLENGEEIETGFFMNELAVPARAMRRAGLTLVYATPGGEPPAMDPSSDKASYFESEAAYERYRSFLGEEGLLEDKAEVMSFEAVLDEGLGRYVGLFVPGGLAPTVDLATHPELGDILGHFHDEAKPTAMLCHGPAALLSTLPDARSFIQSVHAGNEVEPPDGWPYAGYELTVISEREDRSTEQSLGGGLKFYPERALRKAGAEVMVREREAGFVTRDRELITGQNPLADREFTRQLLEALAETSKK